MANYYSIRHITRFRYDAPVSESVMEVRMKPRDDVYQRCNAFSLQTQPRARVHNFRDYLGNTVCHFNVPGRHSALVLTAESSVEIHSPAQLPDRLDPATWGAIDAMQRDYSVWDWLQPSHFVQYTDALRAFVQASGFERGDDPLSTLRTLSALLYHSFQYAPSTTRVDSPIDEALEARRGVCQDLAHIMIAMTRQIGIPCRYVSGYLFHRLEDHDRSVEDATHAWVEAYLPELGWVGIDPTNNLMVGERHIRAAIGRDYSDVPPTRGVFKGAASSDLFVSVRVSPTQAPPPGEQIDRDDQAMPDWAASQLEVDEHEQQQQQQQ